MTIIFIAVVLCDKLSSKVKYMNFSDSAKRLGSKTLATTKKVLSFFNRHQWFLCLTVGLLLNFIIECLHRHSFLQGVIHTFTAPLPFLFNSLVISTVLSICSLFKRRYFLYCFFVALFLGFGIANCVLLALRVTPLEWADLQIVKISLITKYLNWFAIALIVIALLGAIIGLIFLFIKMPKSKINYLKEGISAASFVAVLVVSLLTFRATDILLSSHTKNLANAYKQYGFNYCFLCSMFDLGIDEPQVYTQSDIDKITTLTEQKAAQNSTIKENAAALSNGSKPNIIFLQLETFFDVNHLSGVQFSEDPIPNFSKLHKNFSSGYLGVPSIGAGTANTEFEIISGMSLDHFGMGEYPYKTVLQTEACETICYNLKNNGYTSHAIHNNTAVFYDRNLVFSNMGFDTFTSIEYMQDVEYTSTGWAKDNVLLTSITDCLDSTKGSDMVYTITVQSHGRYPSEYEDELPIDVTGFSEDESINAEFRYYINQLNEVDKFLGDLLETLKNRNERTVVVMYGDHLPSFEISPEDLEGGDLFRTEYVIWDNFGLKKQDGDVAAYAIGAHTMGLIGIENGVLTKLHQNCSDEPQYLEWLRTLEYDMLYGERFAWGGKENYPYKTTDLKMGVKDVTITNVTLNEDGTVTVSGTQFTDHSRILLNDKTVDTVFVDNFTLMSEGELEISTGDHIAVVQVDNSGSPLSSSKYYLVGGTEEYPIITEDKENIIYKPKGFKLSTAIAIIVAGIAIISLSVTTLTVSLRRKSNHPLENNDSEPKEK